MTQEEKKMVEAMGWTITCESPMEMEHETGASAYGYAVCQLVIENAIEEYKQLKDDGEIEDEEETPVKETVKLNLEDINGYEILEFLNEQIRDNEDLCDISMGRPLEFEAQEIKDSNMGRAYKLTFSAYYNNWGTDQLIEDNSIRIYENGDVQIWVEEAFEGDGTDEALEDVLKEWLKTHTFKSKDEMEIKWKGMIQFCQEKLNELSFSDADTLDKIIEELTEAKSLMK